MDKELDKIVDAAIEEAIIQKHQYDYDEEVENAEEYCCDDCVGQASYFLKG